MGSKWNQLSVGIILFLLGVFAFFQTYSPHARGGYVGGTMLFICGFAFLLLYRTKQKSWSLILGAYLSFIGFVQLIQAIFPHNISSLFYGAMFFLVPGAIFLVLYFQKNKSGLLLPGFLLLWFGGFLLFKDIPLFYHQSGALFLLTMGAALINAFLVGKGLLSKWVFYLGVFLLICSFLSIGGMTKWLYVFPVPKLLPLILIGGGLFVVIRSFRHK